MKKILGILGLLIVVVLITSFMNPDFLRPYNTQNNLRWIGLYGIMGIGAAFVIITGGIDLSIGSVVGLIGCLLPMFIVPRDAAVSPGMGMPVWLGILLVLAVSLAIGVAHGLLVTKLRLQPFIVTLCGLLIYRGIARYITGDATKGFGQGFEALKYLDKGKPFDAPIPFIGYLLTGEHANGAGFLGVEWVPIQMPFIILIVIAIIAAVFLNRSVYGRYLLALGRNEQAARFSGINTDRMVLLAYVISALAAGIAGILFALDLNSIQPSSHGNFYELYAIAAAVLGGCSLRGGEGTILGVVLGTAIIRVLSNAINVLGIPTQLEFAVIGAVILIGVIVDELVKRIAARRRAVREAAGFG